MNSLRRFAFAVIAACVLGCTLVHAVESQARPRSIVLLLAHADDESAASPVIARYARAGVQIHMIIVSDGSGGSGSQTYLTRPDSGPRGDSLAKVRAEEARCAASALGIREPLLLGFPDGKLGDYLGDRGLLARLTDRVAKEIERLQPDVVITWGPDGGTGHPDHRIVSNIATQLLRFGASGMPERLFYMYLPEEAFRTMNPQRGAPPMVIPQAKCFTMQVPFTQSDADAALKSMACHRTQFTPELMERVTRDFANTWKGIVRFVPASAGLAGNDLFAR
jgi:LmbE family N-acetylglucosaminyl deacetylase